MVALISVLTILSLSILVTKIATVALTHTGLSKAAARFQARSAFTGVGFTTREAEQVANHPVRRRIVMALMLLGNAGIVSVIASVVLTIVEERGTLGLEIEYRIALLAAGILCLLYLARSTFVDRMLSRLIDWALDRWTDLDVRDYVALLRLSGAYQVRELCVEEEDWLTHKNLGELKLRDEGIQVLGIVRDDGGYVGAPKGTTTVSDGDTLILYGKAEHLSELDQRVRGAAGDREHDRAVAQQEREEQREEATEG